MAAQFQRAPEVEEIARGLIGLYHSHLVEANIVYLLRDGEWESQGRTVLGKTYKVSGREQFFSGADFAIVINRKVWFGLADAEQRALVDHELCHCGTNGHDDAGNPRWCIWGHDVEEFRAIIDRHGLWATDLRRFAERAARHIKQRTLFDMLPEAEETQEPTQEPAEVTN